MQWIQSLFALTCNVTYYGETERHLKVRAGWHKSMSALTGKGSIKAKNLPLKITAFFSGHVCSFDGFTVLNYEAQKFKCLVKESLLFTNNKLNNQVKSRKLHLFKFSFIFAIFLHVGCPIQFHFFMLDDL